MKKIIALYFLSLSCITFSQVGIGTTTPDPSALLDIVSSSSGILIPRMSQSERDAILAPIEGLLIYQQNNVSGFYYFNGIIWIRISVLNGEFRSINGIVQNTTNIEEDDFVFGSTQLSDVVGVADNSRLFFDKSKSAFRVGLVTGNQWNDTNIGDFSFASGNTPIASGNNAIAMGRFATATQANTIAIGNLTSASEIEAVAIGSSAIASESSAISIGNGTNASGIRAGDRTEASGQTSTAMGSSTRAVGTSSVAMGDTSAASGNFSIAIGRSSVATANNAVAIGNSNMASGISSLAMGSNSIASSTTSIRK